MMSRPILRNVLLAAFAAAATADASAAELSAPRSLGFGPSALGSAAQTPSLWYYGPSYSLRYDRLPAGAPHPGQPYRPSLRSDPFYGSDYLERSERGHRFGR